MKRNITTSIILSVGILLLSACSQRVVYEAGPKLVIFDRNTTAIEIDYEIFEE